MICPECGTEYQPGFDRCFDCGVLLIHETEYRNLVEERDRERERYRKMDIVSVHSVQGQAEAELVRSLLEANGIESFTRSSASQSVHPFTVDGLGEIRILVREEDVEGARRLIREFVESREPGNHRSHLPMLALAVFLYGCASAGTAVKEGGEADRYRGIPGPERTVAADVASAYRIGVIDEVALNVPRRIQSGIFREPGEYIEPLIGFLTGGVESEFARVKVIHDWIADNIAYDVDSFLSGDIAGQGYESVLRSGSSVCEGYSGLFQKMCEIAGIECVKISGYARGYGFDIFAAEDVSNTNHAWNAVNIDGTWYPVDVTWDAGYVDRKSYHEKYSTKYLFLMPEMMIYTHYPLEDEWQLLDRPVPADEFLSLPQLDGQFFHYGIDVPKGLGKINETGGEITIELTAGDDVMLGASFYGTDGEEHRAFVQRMEGVSELTLRFPEPGNWRTILYGKFVREEKYSGCGEVGFVAGEGSSKTFPVQYVMFFEHDCYLHAPFYSPLKVGALEGFRITIPGALQAAVVIDGEWTMFEREAEGSDVFLGELEIPETDQVTVYAKWEENSDFNGLLAFDVSK